MKYYFSAGLFPWRQLSGILEFCRTHDIVNIELGPSLAYSKKIMDTVLSQANRFEFIIHNYFPPPQVPFVLNLASLDPIIHQKSLQMCRDAIDLSSQLKAPFYSIHAGFAIDFPPSFLGDPVALVRISNSQSYSKEKSYERFVAAVRKLCLYSESKAVQLLVENNVVSTEMVTEDKQQPLLLSTPEELANFFSDVNDENAGLLLDTGHAKVTARSFGIQPEAFFEKSGAHIRALHLSDNNGEQDTNQPFDQASWFAPLLKRYRHLPLIIEVYNLQLEAINRQRQNLEALMAT
jgi:sugar phosphate isomerase/epimerase